MTLAIRRKRQDCTVVSDVELAKELGISKARVSQIRQRAMEKMRRNILRDPELKAMAAEICGHELREEK